MLDDFLYHLRIADGVMHNLRAPAVAVLGACKIDGIAFLSFADEHAIADDDSVVVRSMRYE